MKIFKDIAIIERDTHISKWVKESGRLDHDLSMVPKICEYIKPGDVVVDAGAYIGDHTIAYAKKVTHSGAVFAFEPNKEAFECLEYNMRNYPQVQCFNHGLGDKFGRIGVNTSCDNVGMSFIQQGNDVTIMPIDDLNLYQVDLIKIDCEGFELNILKGAINTLKKFKPKLVIEINSGALNREGVTPEHVYSFLRELGYKYKNIYSNHELTGNQFDIICT